MRARPPTPTAGGTNAPGPFGHPLLGSTPALRRAPLRTLMERWREYGDVVRFRLGIGSAFAFAFALMEAQLALATIAQHCRLDLAPGQRIVLDPKITLRPRNGLLMTLHRV